MKGKTDKFTFPEKPNYQYQLVGIIVHSGTTESGHYYSLVKLGENWFVFDDSRVSEFKISNLRNECFGGSSEHRKNAYFLFYEKLNSNNHGIFLKYLQPHLGMKKLI